LFLPVNVKDDAVLCSGNVISFLIYIAISLILLD